MRFNLNFRMKAGDKKLKLDDPKLDWFWKSLMKVETQCDCSEDVDCSFR